MFDRLRNIFTKNSRKLAWTVVKDLLPFGITLGLAIVLFCCLGRSKIIDVGPLDAFTWPAFSALTNETATNSAINVIREPQPTIGIDKPFLSGEVVHGIFLVVTYVFILLNTLAYLIESKKHPDNIRHGAALTLAWRMTLLCEGVTGCWLLKVIYQGGKSEIGFKYFDDRMASIRFLDEKVALGIFCFFLVIDLLSWIAYWRSNKANPDAAADIKARFALNQAAVVDFPVIFGIGMSIWMADHVSRNFVNSGNYLLGFFSGATVMHLAASQVIYTILAIKADYAKWCLPEEHT